jgi:hypothetical protein
MIDTVLVSVLANAATLLGSGQAGVQRAELVLKFETSPEGVRARRLRLLFRTTGAGILAFAAVVILFGSLTFHWRSSLIAASIGASVVLAGGVAVVGSIVYNSALGAFLPQAALNAEQKFVEEQERLARDIALPALLRYNREQMSRYHQIATTQARVAGRNSQIAMAVGFAALIGGSTVAIVSNDSTTKIVTGGLAAMGGIFSGFITRTFFVAQDKAISQLYKYWAQPLASSYFLAAERLVDGLTDGRSKDKELGKLIDQLLLIALHRDESLPPIVADASKNNYRRGPRSNATRGVASEGAAAPDAVQSQTKPP